MLIPSLLFATACHALLSPSPAARTTALYGLFDGIKDAFTAEDFENSPSVDIDRETPIDRWLGIKINAERDASLKDEAAKTAFVDSMEPSNYVVVQLTKPMGIVFEENDPSTGGVFVASLAEGSTAESD